MTKGAFTMFTLLVFAFIAGFITILSPCILSIAPILLTAGTGQSRYKPLGIIVGIIISFSFFTLALSAIIHATGISPDIFRNMALTIIIFFGLTMVIPSLGNAFTQITARITPLGNELEKQSSTIKIEFLSGLLLGVALGIIWTPCAGPLLATVSAVAATGGITITTVLITIFYSIGAAVPMLALCFGGEQIMRSTTAIMPYAESIRKTFGVIIIMSALAIAFHVDVMIQEKFAHIFPTISIENSNRLQKELDMLKETPKSTTLSQAPELVGISEWLNSTPLTLEQLRGKVVLLDFWTYTCINCIRTLPHVTQWYTTYKDYGFEIIGVHTPEFAFEKTKSHVEDAIKRFKITYPIALDNDYQTWKAYNNRYWPAHYLIDQNGIIVKTHFGEGHYTEMENAIRALLNLPPLHATNNESVLPQQITPETYLGSQRSNKNDPVTLNGAWTINPDCAQSNDNNNTLTLKFVANHVYLVMQSEKPQLITVLLDGKPVPAQYRSRDMNAEGKILVHAPRMYEIIDLKNDYDQHLLTLQCPAGINAYAFTFGG